MTTSFAPFGFVAVEPRHGATAGRQLGLENGIASTYTTAIGIGDPVAPATDGTFILSVATSTQISGIFAGCNYIDSTGTAQTGAWPGTVTNNTCKMAFYIPADDFGQVYTVQANGTVAQSAIGACFPIVIGTPGTNGNSTSYVVATGVIAAGTSGAVKCVGRDMAPNNNWDDTFTVLRVIINEPSLQFRPGVGV